jgi:hypothetical protein
MFQKELYNGIPNVVVWRVLRKMYIFKGLQTVHPSTPEDGGFETRCKKKKTLRPIVRQRNKVGPGIESRPLDM